MTTNRKDTRTHKNSTFLLALGPFSYVSASTLSHNPFRLVTTYQALATWKYSETANQSQRSSVLFRFVGLVSIRRNQLCHGGQLRSQKINIHCESVTLCEYLSQYEASRGPEPRNQYLLVLPSEELDFTIRSACSPGSTSNIISWLDMSCTDVAD